MNKLYFRSTILMSTAIFILLSGINVQAESVGKKEKLNKSTDKVYRLRCWQEGRLLFDETHLTSKFLKSNIKLIDFEREKLKNSNVSLFVVGSSTCLFKAM